MKKATKRATIDFSDDAFNKLVSVSEDLNISKSEAIRKALALLDLIINEQKDGYDLVLTNEKKNLKKEIRLI